MPGVQSAIISGLLVVASGHKSSCPDKLQAVYADMHDGDQKEITISGTSLTIKPSGNNQTWTVTSEVDVKSCSASIDFDVPGKPGPPPVNLTATLWNILSSQGTKTEFEFTDPTGTLADKDFPLNRWVELTESPTTKEFHCRYWLDAVYADMHDGDMKQIIIDGPPEAMKPYGASLTIKPYGNNQTWIVKSTIDRKTCTANIDFNVPGKPGPPPVNLTATFLYNERSAGTDRKSEFEFTDPTGTLAAADFPLNHWVEISRNRSHHGHHEHQQEQVVMV